MMSMVLDAPFGVAVPNPRLAVTYHVSVLTDIAQVEALACEWDAFLAAAGVENISLGFEWVKALLHYFPQEKLCVIVLRDGDQRIVALAPLAINRGNIRFSQRLLRYVRFLGAKEFLYDWMQLPIRRDADPDLVIRLITRALFGIRREWDVLEFQSHLGQDELQVLSKELTAYGGAAEMEKGDAMPKVILAESCEAYEADRAKKRVHRDVKRFTKKLEEKFGEKPLLSFVESPDSATDELQRFFEQHAQYWLARTGTSNFKTYPQLIHFYRHILRSCNKQTGTPYLSFSKFSVAGTDLSYQLGIWYEWGYMNYLNNYNQEHKAFRPGILHMDGMIRASIGRGAKVFSFGQGEESYKDLWADSRDQLWHFRYFKTPLVRKVFNLDLHLLNLKSKLKSANAK